MAKKLILVLLLAFIVEHAPWRLATLLAESLILTPSRARMVDGVDQYWHVLDLTDRLARLGYEVQYVPDLAKEHEAWGITNPQLRIIVIDDSLSWNARMAVLAHEAGHTQMIGRFTEGQSEVLAESVSALISHNGLREHARYLAQLRADMWVAVVYWPDIYRAAELLRP